MEAKINIGFVLWYDNVKIIGGTGRNDGFNNITMFNLTYCVLYCVYVFDCWRDNIVICVIDDFDIHLKDWFIFKNDYMNFFYFSL